jgi:hypothetical protein
MATVSRKSVSFDEGEVQALDALLDDKEALEILQERLSRLRFHVPALGSYLDVDALDVASVSDLTRALVRVGLDAVDRDYMSRAYARVAPTMAQFLAEPGVKQFLDESSRVTKELEATLHATVAPAAVRR